MVDGGEGALEAARGGRTRQDVVVAASWAAPAVFPVVHFQGAFVVVQVHHHSCLCVWVGLCLCVMQWAKGKGRELERKRRMRGAGVGGARANKNKTNASPPHPSHHRRHVLWWLCVCGW